MYDIFEPFLSMYLCSFKCLNAECESNLYLHKLLQAKVRF